MTGKMVRIARKGQFLPLLTHDLLVLAGSLVFFACLSLVTITRSSVWFDEAFAAYIIRFDFDEIARYTAADVHPPLYYWLLKLWSSVFGMSELALRSMSVMFAGVAIFFGFLLIRRLFGKKPAFITLILIILSPMLLRYSQEMRMYTLVTAIVFAATYLLIVAMETRQRRHWIIYGLLVGLGMWTHYFSALVWTAHWIWRMWVLRGESGKSHSFAKMVLSRDWIIAHVVALGTFIPWLPFLVNQTMAVQTGGFWIRPLSMLTVPNYVTNIFYFLDQSATNTWALAILVGIVTVIFIMTVRLCYRLDPKERRNYMLLLMLAFVPVFVLLVISIPPLRPLFIDRYVVPSAVGVSLWIGVTLALGVKVIRPVWLVVIGMIVAGMMIFGISNVLLLGNYNKTTHSSQNTRQTIEILSQRASNGEPIIAESPWVFYEAVLYSTVNHPVYFLDETTNYKYGSLDMLKYNDTHKIKDLDEFTRLYPIVWILGTPKTNELRAPRTNWRELQDIKVEDSINHTPLYEAAQYKTN